MRIGVAAVVGAAVLVLGAAVVRHLTAPQPRLNPVVPERIEEARAVANSFIRSRIILADRDWGLVAPIVSPPRLSYAVQDLAPGRIVFMVGIAPRPATRIRVQLFVIELRRGRGWFVSLWEPWHVGPVQNPRRPSVHSGR